MANPIWKTTSGNLGTIEERVYYALELEADNSSSFQVISGSLPAGLSLKTNGLIDGIPSVTDLIGGVPFDVGKDVTSEFVIRATSSDSIVSDRTFELTVTGQDKPTITTGGNLGSFIEGDYVELEIEAEDLDNDPLVYAIADGSLPAGLTLNTTTGAISGYIEPLLADPDKEIGYDVNAFDEYEFDSGTISIDTNYFFTISVSDGKDIVQRNFTIFVYSRNNLTADNNEITADDTSVITADQDTKRNPVLIFDSTSIGTTFHDDYFAHKFIAKDYDEDIIEFELSTDGSSFTIPTGLILDTETGYLYGYLSYQAASEIDYTFQIRAKKQNDSTYASEYQSFELKVLGDNYRNVTWQTATNLGNINTGDISTLYVEAIDQNNKELQYTLPDYENNRLPQGLQFNQDGTISGRVGFEVFSLDSGSTTLDQDSTTLNTTTIDRKFTFKVRAQDASGLIFSTKVFTLTVVNRNTEPYENLYVQTFMSLDKRRDFDELINNLSIFPVEYLYRKNDFYFSKQSDIRMLMLPGVTAKTAAQFTSAMAQHHYAKRLRFGSIKTARALDSNGSVKYEVVYIDIVDDIQKISQLVSLERDVATNIGISTVYPNSLNNMIAQIKDEIGITDPYVYPEWMTSTQEDGTVLGWIPAVVLAYVEPGYSKQVAYNIETKNTFDFKSIDFTIDRYLWDVDMSDGYNKTTREFDVSPETTFDRLNRKSFTGDGSTTAFAMSDTITNASSVLVTFDGTTVNSTTYTISGATVTFSTAPALGVEIVIEDTNFTTELNETTFDNKNTKFISGSIPHRQKDFGDKYLKFPTNGVLD